MYGFSRGFSVKAEGKVSEWQQWHIVKTSSVEKLEKSLEEGGFIVERNEGMDTHQYLSRLSASSVVDFSLDRYKGKT